MSSFLAYDVARATDAEVVGASSSPTTAAKEIPVVNPKKGADTEDKERGRKIPQMQTRLKSPLVPQSDKCGRGFRLVVTGGSAADPPRPLCIPESLDAATEGAEEMLRSAQREARSIASDAIQRARLAEQKAKQRQVEEYRALAEQAGDKANPLMELSRDASAGPKLTEKERRQQQETVAKERKRLEDALASMRREAERRVEEAKVQAAARLSEVDERALQLLADEEKRVEQERRLKAQVLANKAVEDQAARAQAQALQKAQEEELRKQIAAGMEAAIDTLPRPPPPASSIAAP